MKVLVTGAAGFIGFHVAQKLCARGDEVVGIDNLNDYYEVSLKQARLQKLAHFSNFKFIRLELADRECIAQLFTEHGFQRVIHLGAQAGVRYSLENPHAYVDSNLVGFVNILEGCRHHRIEHLSYASSSSVYGANKTMPFSVHDNVDHPLSLYAATKKANELMAHTYSHLYQLPTTGLRFFTVYGPWGRPDMAIFNFTHKILSGEPIDVFNFGNHRRDFTYIDDIVEGILRVHDHVAAPNLEWSGESPDPGTSAAPWRVYNIGNSSPVQLLHYIEVLEECLGKKAQMNLLPMQPGDVPDTYADVEALKQDVGYKPGTPIEVGVRHFVDWYRDYYAVSKSSHVSQQVSS
ncbi:NAD-dependent epimerase [Legionella drancourtii]|uniref:Nucleoside-diphosphate-sugar epimerase n=1 Tax=Legionella drancourtii LLAP12 TaxID=658187 RepID=G9ETR1_9GAMM|nr:NAD-dependent epimerase [Legionella drancourtii]EHL29262.1 nucleoside-diphosphate-sugar epimerase [Legionella drancourtii LLAP12]